ncbi:MAG: hypothetical protein KDC01_01580, partial [Flavobacteriales bacterium]|nr:hypothetical protein [Flavobacteriales bacterium]
PPTPNERAGDRKHGQTPAAIESGPSKGTAGLPVPPTPAGPFPAMIPAQGGAGRVLWPVPVHGGRFTRAWSKRWPFAHPPALPGAAAL